MPAQMKFERFTVPDLPLPDLVAFNRRVHERVDPWFERRWVRRGAWLGVFGFLFFAAVWLYCATGLPSTEQWLAYQPSLPTNGRGYDGSPVQNSARKRCGDFAYD